MIVNRIVERIGVQASACGIRSALDNVLSEMAL